MPEFKIRDLMIDVLVDDVALHCQIINSCFNALSNTPDLWCKRVHTCFHYLTRCWFFRTPIFCWFPCSRFITRIPVETEPCGISEIPETIVDLGETIQYHVDQTVVAIDVGSLVINPGNIDAVRKQLNMVLDNTQKVAGDKAGDLRKEAATLAESLTKAAEQLRKIGK